MWPRILLKKKFLLLPRLKNATSLQDVAHQIEAESKEVENLLADPTAVQLLDPSVSFSYPKMALSIFSPPHPLVTLAVTT